MGKRIDILRSFKYIVKIEDQTGRSSSLFAKLGFSKVSGLTHGSSDVIEYREGNENIFFRKLPGLHKYKNVVLERGKGTGNKLLAIENWRDQVSSYKKGESRYYHKTVKIELYARNGQLTMQWILYNAWPVSLDYSDLDAQSSAFLIETIEIAYEGVDIIRY